MSLKQRTQIDFSNTPDENDLSNWPKNSSVKEVAEASGFVSRQPVALKKSLRRRRTGRTQQLNIKLKPDTIEKFYSLADNNNWGLGQAFEEILDNYFLSNDK